MTCLNTPSDVTDANRNERCSAAAIVSAYAVAAFVLGAVLRLVALQSLCEYQWEGYSDEEVAALDAVVQAVGIEIWCLGYTTAFATGDDLYRPIENSAYSQAREILSRADVQRALDALIAALLIHVRLTGCEAAEIILTAFVED